MTLLQSLQQRRQSVWLDEFERRWITSSQLQHYVDDGVRGAVSNIHGLYTAFQKNDYDRDFNLVAQKHNSLSAQQYYEYVIIRDLQLAADLLKQTHSQTHRQDGYIQIDLLPHALLQPETAIAEAQKIWRSVGWSNVLIGIPATQSMLPVIERLIRDRINVNATFVVSQTCYEQVFDAYLQGLNSQIRRSEPVAETVCFASFPIGQFDGATYRLGNSSEAAALGVVQAKRLYQSYQKAIRSDRWNAFSKSANPLRLVWNCTGVDPPEAWRYVQALATPDTAIVLSPSTLEHYRDISLLPTLLADFEAPPQNLPQSLLSQSSLQDIANQIISEEMARSQVAFDRLLRAIDQKR